jgi:hypothetical protein
MAGSFMGNTETEASGRKKEAMTVIFQPKAKWREHPEWPWAKQMPDEFAQDGHQCP